jgi:chromosome segregation ATPase
MDQIDTMDASQPYSSGVRREERLGRIEQLVKTVMPNYGITKNGTYMDTALANMHKGMEILKYNGLDVDNMNKVYKAGVDIATFLGITGPYKRLDKKRSKLQETVTNLDNIVENCKRDLYHPSRGLYTELTKMETQRDEAMELRELTKAEMQDLQLEKMELRRKFDNKEYGSGMEYESREQISKQIRKLDRAYETVSELKTQTNLRIKGSNKRVIALEGGIEMLKANMARISDKSYEIREVLETNQSMPQTTEYLSQAATVLNGGIANLLQGYVTDLESLQASNNEIYEYIDNIGDFPVPVGGNGNSRGDLVRIIEESKKRDEARDTEVMEIIEQINQSPFRV